MIKTCGLGQHCVGVAVSVDVVAPGAVAALGNRNAPVAVINAP